MRTIIIQNDVEAREICLKYWPKFERGFAFEYNIFHTIIRVSDLDRYNYYDISIIYDNIFTEIKRTISILVQSHACCSQSHML